MRNYDSAIPIGRYFLYSAASQLFVLLAFVCCALPSCLALVLSE